MSPQSTYSTNITDLTNFTDSTKIINISHVATIDLQHLSTTSWWLLLYCGFRLPLNIARRADAAGVEHAQSRVRGKVQKLKYLIS